MLQLFFAVAFSAVPLTLYVPPIRSLNLFVETLEDLLRHTAVHSLRAYPRFRLAFSRLFRSVFRVSHSRYKRCWFMSEFPSYEYELDPEPERFFRINLREQREAA